MITRGRAHKGLFGVKQRRHCYHNRAVDALPASSLLSRLDGCPDLQPLCIPGRGLSSLRLPAMAEASASSNRSGAGVYSANGKKGAKKKAINLLRGWPSPELLPVAQLRAAADRALTDPAVSVPALQYGPDPGYQPLREELARWLTQQYRSPSASASAPGMTLSADEIAITGGASQGMACILQSFADPGYTRAVWAAAPCYYLACPTFEDAGFAGRLRAVPENEGGIDLEVLERGLREVDEAEKGKEEVCFVFLLIQFPHPPSTSDSPVRKGVHLPLTKAAPQ